MAFRLKPDETLADGFRRVAAEQAERVGAHILAAPIGDDAVHGARKGLKRLRALLRLVRPALGEDAWRRENGRLRDAGRLLAGARDTHVMMQTVAALAAETEAGTPDAAALGTLQGLLADARGEDAADVARAGEQAATLVAEAAASIATLPLAGDGFGLVAPGLVATYRRGRHAMAKARRTGADEDIHDWRKATQSHWRHMRLLSEGWPALLEARARLASELSELLGADHDLAVLCQRLDDAAFAKLGPRRRRRIEALARARQAKLRGKAFQMGRLLYSDGPKGLGVRMARYWAIAVAAADAAGEAETASGEAASRIRRGARGGRSADGKKDRASAHRDSSRALIR